MAKPTNIWKGGKRQTIEPPPPSKLTRLENSSGSFVVHARSDKAAMANLQDHYEWVHYRDTVLRAELMARAKNVHANFIEGA